MTAHGSGTNGDDAPTWGVVMTVREPLALVLCNVLWHGATGADQVFVYLDDPEDPAAQHLASVPGCHVQICDDAYWAAKRGKDGPPPSQMRRQTINANDCQMQCTVDWLFHIDADEFIWQDGDLRRELAGHRDPATEINLRPFERVFPENGQTDLFDGAFRSSADLSDAEARVAYAPFAAFMKRGQYSHGAGKSGVMVRQGLRMGVHNALIRREDQWRRAPKHASKTARLLHFDGLTPLHWALKVMRYLQTPDHVQRAILQPHRLAQIAWMQTRSANVDTARAAHHTLFALTPERRAQLDHFGLLHDIPFDPKSEIGTAIPGLSPQAFDADLLQRNPWLGAIWAQNP